MTCDYCNAETKQLSNAKSGDPWACDACAKELGIRVPGMSLSMVEGNSIRERWEAEQREKRAAKLKATLAVECDCGHARKVHSSKRGCIDCDCPMFTNQKSRRTA